MLSVRGSYRRGIHGGCPFKSLKRSLAKLVHNNGLSFYGKEQCDWCWFPGCCCQPPRCFDVFVNCCKLIIIPSQVKACLQAKRNHMLVQLNAALLDLTHFKGHPAPFFSDAVQFFKDIIPLPCDHCSTVLAMVMFFSICFISILLNQQRSQLSWEYCTISKKGGDVTVNCTDASGMEKVCRASASRKRRCGRPYANFPVP
jgi:hypothetical protein